VRPPSADGHRSRLLALDVDGTLLTSGREVSARTHDALTRAHAAGWHVALVTGRPLEVALPVANHLSVGDYLVASNGATVAERVSERVLFQATLEGALVREAIHRARAAIPGLRVAVTTARAGFLGEPGIEGVAPLSATDATVVEDASPGPADEVHGVVFFVAGADPEELVVQVQDVLPDGVSVAPSGLESSVELAPPGVHKATGLARLCEIVQVPASRVVAFGDGLNDNEMLRWAGHSVAMGNAAPATKALADEVTATNDEDGVALVVERLLDAEAEGVG
jgi:Cof subfamily protein (haloacid dehalogenase superfamily)